MIEENNQTNRAQYDNKQPTEERQMTASQPIRKLDESDCINERVNKKHPVNDLANKKLWYTTELTNKKARWSQRYWTNQL